MNKKENDKHQYISKLTDNDFYCEYQHDGMKFHETDPQRPPTRAEHKRLQMVNDRLRAKFAEIAQSQFGLDRAEDAESEAEYWSNLALRYREIARSALNDGGET